MQILLTTPTYPPLNSGLGNAVAQQAAFLARAGHKVTVATGGSQRSSRLTDGIQVDTFAVTGADSWVQPIRGEVSIYTDFLRHNDWDVVLLNAWQNWATDVALRHFKEISGRKFVYSHCISTNVFYSQQPFRSILRYVAWRPYWRRLPDFMRRLNGMLFLAGDGSDSRFDDLHIARRNGIPLRILPNCLSPTATALLNRNSEHFFERDRVVAVGSYHWQKGFDFVIRAYAASQLRHRFALHLFGQEYSTYTLFLRSLVQKLRLPSESVIFHEGVSGKELLDAYSRALLLLFGSFSECQPLALIDASATGTPFIARESGCIAKMPGGFVVSSFPEMAMQMDLLSDSKMQWECLSHDGRNAAREIYHPDLVGQKLIDIITAAPGSDFPEHNEQ